MMRLAGLFLMLCALATAEPHRAARQPDLTWQQTYTFHRASSADPRAANADSRASLLPAQPTRPGYGRSGMISHIWFTMSDRRAIQSSSASLLRMYWDGETTPSVETPIGDFFGLGLGDYHNWQSEMLSVGSIKALNCFFPMPFRHHARITVTNEGKQPIGSLYYNIDYRTYSHPLPRTRCTFMLQYRQAQPNQGWTNSGQWNGDPLVNDKNEPGWQGQLCLAGGEGAWTIRRRDHVGAAEPGWMVGRGR